MIKKIYIFAILIALHSGCWALKPGTPDPTFGTNGIVIDPFTEIPGEIVLTGIVAHPNNTIMVVGNASNSAIVANYLNNGTRNRNGNFGNVAGYTIWPGFKTYGIALQNNLTLVTTGSTTSPSSGQTGLVVRNFLSNGNLVSGFSNSIIASSAPNEGLAVAVNKQSEIISAGYANFFGTTYRIALTKSSPMGVFDTVFGNGRPFLSLDILSPTPNTDTRANAVAIDAQNRIVIAGSIMVEGERRFVTARLLPSGQLNAAQFGIRSRIPGTVEADFSPLTNIETRKDSAQAIAIQTISGEEKLVVAGMVLLQQSPERYGLALVRYNSNGSLDTTFGTPINGNRSGMIVSAFGDYTAQGYSLAIDAWNNIIVVGQSLRAIGQNPQALVASYNSQGDLNQQFGTNGVIKTSFTGNQSSYARSIAIDKNNNILVGGWVFDQAKNGRVLALARYIGNTEPLLPGSMDRTFGTDGTGTVTTPFNGDSAITDAKILPSNNNIITSGTLVLPGNITRGILSSYRPDGSLDTSFGANPTSKFGYKIDFSFLPHLVVKYNAVGISPYRNETIIAVGSLLNTNTRAHGFTRHGFSVTGEDQQGFVIQHPFTFPDSTKSEANATAVYPDGSFVTAGYNKINAVQHAALIKFVSVGVPDSTFGAFGMVQTFFDRQNNDFSEIKGLALYSAQSGNKIVVTGRAVINDQQRFVLARYLSNGRLDSSFGDLVDKNNPSGPRTGKLVVDFSPITLNENRNDIGNAVALQTINNQTKIIAAGAVSNRTGRPFFALARFNDDGTLDQSFGYPGTGFKLSCFGTVKNEAKAIVIDENNKIVVAGLAEIRIPQTNDVIETFIIARYLPNGQRDQTFGSGGKVFTSFFNQNAGALALTLQTIGGNQKIVAGGYAVKDSKFLSALARYNT